MGIDGHCDRKLKRKIFSCCSFSFFLFDEYKDYFRTKTENVRYIFTQPSRAEAYPFKSRQTLYLDQMLYY